MRRGTVVALAIALTLAPPSWVGAQDEEEEESESFDEETDGSEEGEPGSEDEEFSEEGGEPAEEGDGASAGAAAARSWYFGPYFRYVFVPAFMLELFLEEAPTVGNAAFGVAANYRSGDDGPSFQIGIGYTGYGFEDPFRATGDPVEDTEWVDSSLGLVHVTGSILWNAELAPGVLTFEYGIGVDVGIVTGSLVRTEAYEGPAGWQPCQSRGIPNPFYCEQPSRQGIETNRYDEDGAHYGVEEERVPPVALLPMVPHLALRLDAMKNFAVKVEAAYGIAQIWLGLSAAYAPEL